MRTEEQCSPSERYLMADAWFSNKAITILRSEAIMRCKDQAYEPYIHWRRQVNEVVVSTSYAYADLAVPKQFDIIFEVDNPANFVNTPYTLVYSVLDAWYPVSEVGHGHRHLCVLRFSEELPAILLLLYRRDERLLVPPKDQKYLGFCNSKDFDAITKRIEKVQRLRLQYGTQWWEHDDG